MSEGFDFDKENLRLDEYEKKYGKKSAEYKAQEDKVNKYLASLKEEESDCNDLDLSALDSISAVDCLEKKLKEEDTSNYKRVEVWIPEKYLNFNAAESLEDDNYLKVYIKDEQDCLSVDNKFKDLYAGGLRSALTTLFKTIRWPEALKINKKKLPVYEYINGELYEKRKTGSAYVKDKVSYEGSMKKAQLRIKLKEDKEFFQELKITEISSVKDLIEYSYNAFYKNKDYLKKNMQKKDYNLLFRTIRDYGMGRATTRNKTKFSPEETENMFETFNNLVSWNNFKKILVKKDIKFNKIIFYARNRNN